MRPCCLEEARRSLHRHRDVATCDDCGALLLAYGNDIDYRRTVEEFENNAVEFESKRLGKLKIVAKTKSDPAS